MGEEKEGHFTGRAAEWSREGGETRLNSCRGARIGKLRDASGILDVDPRTGRKRWSAPKGGKRNQTAQRLPARLTTESEDNTEAP